MSTHPAALDAALEYAELGWQVFGLPGGKTPHANCDSCHARTCVGAGRCDHPYCHGFYSATADPGRLQAWWRRWPEDLVAVRTGAPSGLAVLDVDPRAGGWSSLARLTQRLGGLPLTATQVTGSGGRHYFYRHPGGVVPSGAHRLGPGLDVKADLAYVVVAPSRTNGVYRWMNGQPGPLAPWPTALTVQLRTRGGRSRPVPASMTTSLPGRPGAHSPTQRRLSGLVRSVLAAQPGERNRVLFWAACRAAELTVADELAWDIAERALLTAAACSGLSDDEALKALRSARTTAAAP